MKESLNDLTVMETAQLKSLFGGLVTCALGPSLRESRDEDRKGPSDIKDGQTVSFIITDQSQSSQLSTLTAQAALVQERDAKQTMVSRSGNVLTLFLLVIYLPL